MKIVLCHSMVFIEKALEIKERLEKSGHEVKVSEYADDFKGKTEKEKEIMSGVYAKEKDAIMKHWEKIQWGDGILVLNFDRRGIKNYIGGNTLMEIGFAYVLDKKIFLLNPIPEIIYYKSEIESVKPVIINGDFSKIA